MYKFYIAMHSIMQCDRMTRKPLSCVKTPNPFLPLPSARSTPFDSVDQNVFMGSHTRANMPNAARRWLAVPTNVL